MEQRERTGCVAIAKSDDLRNLRRYCAKGSDSAAPDETRIDLR